ncbi:MAG: threonine synthase [Candidatus Wallbacteria bacterium]|nr:threonine synthase [Candidatus Wallbacteria bacterium]
MPSGGIIARYGDLLELGSLSSAITLEEGATPLIEARRLPRECNLQIRLLFKFEGSNPTGSFKDRGMTAAVSKAVSAGSRAIVCASTGNTAASAAAYAARAGIACLVLLPKGNVALGKLAQSLVYGATVVAVDGNFDQSLEIVRRLPERMPLTIVNSINPDRLLGQRSAAFEVADALGGAPDYHVLPVGNAGNITATWRGYKRYKEAGRIRRLPVMLGFQAAGAAPIVDGRICEDPRTLATAIRIGNPASWEGAREAASESGGNIDKVTDEEILAAYFQLARTEGIFAEPASAASFAGVLKKARQGYFPFGTTVVCTLTGNGLKDPDNAMKVESKLLEAPGDFDGVCRALEQVIGS